MIFDIATIVLKELKEILQMRGTRRSGLIGLLVFAGVFGIYMPALTGPGWVESPVSLIYWVWLPFFLTTGIIADSIAGERERHTLETLLASRLSDLSILLGKISASIVYTWGLVISIILVSLVTINVVYGIRDGILYMYDAWIFLAVLGFSFLLSMLAAGLGILISLRAESVRQAQQTLSIGFMVIFIPLVLVAQFLPREWLGGIITSLETANWTLIGIIVAIILFLLDAALLAIARKRFQRTKLILD